jgi:hypothetical protein
MSSDDLRRRIRLILSQVQPHHKMYRYTEKEQLSEVLKLKKSLEGDPMADLSETAVVNEQVLLLKTLRGQGGHSEDEFAKALVKEMNDDNAHVIVHSLIELGSLDVVLAVLEKGKRDDLDLRGAIWGALGEKRRREPHRFTDADLDAIDGVRARDETLLRVQQKRRIDDARTI